MKAITWIGSGLAALALALAAGCANTGSMGGMSHGAMSSGTQDSGSMAGSDKSGCPMMAEERKALCEGKSDDDCKKAMQQRHEAMAEHMKGGASAPAGMKQDMCKMGAK